jgi:hypothetical protein
VHAFKDATPNDKIRLGVLLGEQGGAAVRQQLLEQQQQVASCACIAGMPCRMTRSGLECCWVSKGWTAVRQQLL